MAEESKFNLLTNEIAELEKLVYKYVQKFELLNEENFALKKEISKLKEIQEVHKEKIKGLNEMTKNSNKQISDSLLSSKFSLEEKEKLKHQVGELISRIEYHLRT